MTMHITVCNFELFLMHFLMYIAPLLQEATHAEVLAKILATHVGSTQERPYSAALLTPHHFLWYILSR